MFYGTQRGLFARCAWAAALAAASCLASAQSSSTTLTLEQVHRIARERNPAFAEFAANLEAARAEVAAAMAYPNPEVELSAGAARASEEPVDTRPAFGIGITQPIEPGAKRRTRKAAAQAGIDIVGRDERLFEVQLRAEVAKAFYTAVYRRRSLRLAIESGAIAAQLHELVGRRVAGGEAPEIDAIKARVETLKANRAVQSARRNLTAARIALDLLCANALPADYVLTDDFPSTDGAVDGEAARAGALESHPALLRMDALVARQEAAILRERKAWQPDMKPGISAGREYDAESFAMSLGFEVPLWNRNRGGIARAEAELARLKAERDRVRMQTDAAIRAALGNDASARQQRAAIDDALRQGAAEALRVETFLYEQGEHDLLQLLDARRTAQETEAEHLQALIDAAIARVELDAALGTEGETR